MRLIDADALSAKMFHEVFETDTTLQRWDSGCWIRYKLFKDAIENAPTIDLQPVSLTKEEIEVIFIHLNAQKERLCRQCKYKESEEYQTIVDKLTAMKHNCEQILDVRTMADDYISRQAAIDALEELETERLNWISDSQKERQGINAAICAITDLPPADVQPVRRGKWIVEVKHHKDADQHFHYEDIRCSECGANRRIGWYDANFCPNCGADMRGENE